MPAAALTIVAARFKALSEPNRLRLLMALGKDEKSVSDLIGETQLEQTNVSRHLQTLTQAGLLSRRKDGLSVYYRIVDQSIFHICDVVCAGMKDHIQEQAAAFK